MATQDWTLKTSLPLPVAVTDEMTAALAAAPGAPWRRLPFGGSLYQRHPDWDDAEFRAQVRRGLEPVAVTEGDPEIEIAENGFQTADAIEMMVVMAPVLIAEYIRLRDTYEPLP